MSGSHRCRRFAAAPRLCSPARRHRRAQGAVSDGRLRHADQWPGRRPQCCREEAASAPVWCVTLGQRVLRAKPSRWHACAADQGQARQNRNLGCWHLSGTFLTNVTSAPSRLVGGAWHHRDGKVTVWLRRGSARLPESRANQARFGGKPSSAGLVGGCQRCCAAMPPQRNLWLLVTATVVAGYTTPSAAYRLRPPNRGQPSVKKPCHW